MARERTGFLSPTNPSSIAEKIDMSNATARAQGLRDCHDCGASPGEYHELGCDVERCPRCGYQLLTCLACGCEGSDGGEPWPPPLDDREAWGGECPDDGECREFGWYVRVDRDEGLVPCGPREPGALPDVLRLFMETEWDRIEKRRVRTNLTEAFAEMGRRGLLYSRGLEVNRKRSVAELTERAMPGLKRGKPARGYAFYTLFGQLRRSRGKDFAVHFGTFDRDTLPALEVGKLVCDCLHTNGVRHRWDENPGRPIRVVTASVERLP
jgi:hypothetical protein